MRIVNTLVVLTFMLLIAGVTDAQNVEFDKSLFKDTKDAFKIAKKELEAGNAFFELGETQNKDYYKLAIPHFEKANEFNPNNGMLNFQLGICYLHSNYKFKSLGMFQNAYKLVPTVHKKIHYFLGEGQQLNYAWDEAKYEYELYRKTLDQAKQAEEIFWVNKKVGECNTGKRMQANPERVWIDNLGPQINTKYSDYAAMISTDESVLIWTSTRTGSTGEKIDASTGGFYEDVYISEKKDGVWGPSKNMSEPINTDNHDATAGISPDGRTLYIYKGESNSGDILVTQFIDGKWTKPKSVGKSINKKDYHETEACLTYDGKQLYFVSNREGGQGDHDIWISDWNEDKEDWGQPKNLGPTINTKYNERGVFIHPDGKTMYFSSEGHETMGGYDIFWSRKEDGIWSKPVNIGYPVSTVDDDVFFLTSASGRHGYMTSFREDGYGGKDLYLVTFLGPEKEPLLNSEDNLLAVIAQPVKEKSIEPKVVVSSNKLAILTGVIRDEKTKKPVKATVELIDNVKNIVIATFESDGTSGKYLVSLPAGTNYGIAVKSANYLFHSENFNIPDEAGFKKYRKDVDLKKIEVGNAIVLRNVFFDHAKATLRPESKNELDRLIKLLNENPTVRIEMGGHTDSDGSDTYNQKLSEGRAQAVVQFLVKGGINIGRLEFKGYGESDPMATNGTEEGKQLNRRTQFKIISK
jgi:outer membrane protein OmpA-like peptidoglycan-associated protein